MSPEPTPTGEPPARPSSVTVPLIAVTTLAAVAFLAGVRTETSREAVEMAKAQTSVRDGSVLLLAVGDNGLRDLRDQGTIRLDEKIGFVYSNPAGRYSKLTILGWDGEEVHWYYPDSPGQPGESIKGGAAANAVRLPFDIALGEAHHTGRLTIAAAFDLAPDVLSRGLVSGKLEDLAGVLLFRISVTH
ncbi:MAG: hypothetical protein HYV07_33535 [Deltaproteobacteria bacterium]|nr:hypothetical protein [Deltaproteobacteria bacterium]